MTAGEIRAMTRQVRDMEQAIRGAADWDRPRALELTGLMQAVADLDRAIDTVLMDHIRSQPISAAFPPPFPCEGLRWFDTTVQAIREYRDGVWKRMPE